MFDIGFWEIVVVGVVALLVIGPKELPVMMRTVGGWMSKTRHFVNAVKTEIEREAYRADDLKRLLAEQAGIVERHKNIDPTQPAVPVKSLSNVGHNSPDDGIREAAVYPPPAVTATTSTIDPALASEPAPAAQPDAGSKKAP